MANDQFQAKALQILANSDYIQGVAKPGRVIADIQYYVYNGRIGTDAVPLASGVTQTQRFDTHADSDFAISYIEACLQELAGGVMTYNGNTALQIQDLATGKLFFSVPTAMALVSGAGGFPFVLPAPRLFNPNTAIAVSATNRDTIVNGGAGPVGLYYAFHGTRIFYADK